jgi:hypothetical protein
VSSERIVDVGSADEVRLLLVEVADFADRMTVRVFDDRGHAPCCGSSCSGRKVLAAQVTGLHQVNVSVDAARQNQQVAGVNRFAPAGEIQSNRGDPTVLDEEVSARLSSARHDCSAAHQQVGHVRSVMFAPSCCHGCHVVTVVGDVDAGISGRHRDAVSVDKVIAMSINMSSECGAPISPSGVYHESCTVGMTIWEPPPSVQGAAS